MTCEQRQALDGVREANRRLVLARVGGQPRSRLEESTPHGDAIRYRDRMIRLAVESGVSAQRIAEAAEFASADRVHEIVGVEKPRGEYRDDGHGCVERVHPSELAWEERYG